MVGHGTPPKGKCVVGCDVVVKCDVVKYVVVKCDVVVGCGVVVWALLFSMCVWRVWQNLLVQVLVQGGVLLAASLTLFAPVPLQYNTHTAPTWPLQAPSPPTHPARHTLQRQHSTQHALGSVHSMIWRQHSTRHALESAHSLLQSQHSTQHAPVSVPSTLQERLRTPSGMPFSSCSRTPPPPPSPLPPLLCSTCPWQHTPPPSGPRCNSSRTSPDSRSNPSAHCSRPRWGGALRRHAL